VYRGVFNESLKACRGIQEHDLVPEHSLIAERGRAHQLVKRGWVRIVDGGVHSSDRARERRLFEPRDECRRANAPSIAIGPVHWPEANEFGRALVEAAVAKDVFAGMNANQVARCEGALAVTFGKLRLSGTKPMEAV
jgi:hypothetical protein